MKQTMDSVLTLTDNRIVDTESDLNVQAYQDVASY